MKKTTFFLFFLVYSTSSFAHQTSHYNELFSQMLFPIALLGSLICLPLSFLLLISKFGKKFSRLIYAGYAISSFSFFGILRLLYSYIHNHFELTCQIVGFGYYLSIITIIIYFIKLVIFKVKGSKK